MLISCGIVLFSARPLPMDEVLVERGSPLRGTALTPKQKKALCKYSTFHPARVARCKDTGSAKMCGDRPPFQRGSQPRALATPDRQTAPAHDPSPALLFLASCHTQTEMAS